MGAIRLVNNVPPATAPMVEFRLHQGNNQVARLGIHAGGSAAIPVGSNQYTVQAFTDMGEFTLSSKVIDFNADSLALTAEVTEQDGFYNFDLRQGEGSQLNTITLENTWSSPVQFKLYRPNSPFMCSVVVEPNNVLDISTAQRWSVYAIANGVTSPSVEFTNSNATVTATADSKQGTLLQVS